MYVIVWHIINTIHLKKRAYKTRKPQLQFDVLGCLVLNGKLTKGETESLLQRGTHSEIIKAFSKLESKGSIEKIRKYKKGRGRKQWYYKITEEGVKQLIEFDPHPLKFWKILFGYSYHKDKGLTMEEVDSYYNLSLEKFLKYKYADAYGILDYFDEMCEQWLYKTILKEDKLEVEQKVIEVLAIYPGITFKELVERTGSSEYEVEKCLMTFSSLQSYLLTLKQLGDIPLNSREIKKHHDLRWHILLHNIVVVERGSSNRDVRYKLSLFGIILALAIVSQEYRYRLKHGLHYHNLRFADYYDKIAYNYKHKLPLIFGKWNLLKKTLKLLSVYNLYMILDKHIRTAKLDTVIRGGNKELVESLKKIADHNYESILELYTSGIRVGYFSSSRQNRYPRVGNGDQENLSKDYLINNDIDLRSEIGPDKIHNLRKKLDEIALVVQPQLIAHRYIGRSYLENINFRMISMWFEEQLTKEITALYYLQLYSDYAFQMIRHLQPFAISYFDLPNSKPKESLSLLFKNDVNKPLLSGWFYNLIDEINNLQKEIYNALPKRPT